MRALLIDTATPEPGIAAWVHGELLDAVSARILHGTDGWLTPEVDRLVRAMGGVDRIGVTIGPGAFTGIRVGVATALGLAVATGAAVVALSSLALRAAAVPGEPRVLVMLDAKKARVYAAWFETGGPVPRALDVERDVAPEEAVLGSPGVVTGEGALVYGDIVRSAGHRVVADPGASPVRHGHPLLAGGVPRSPQDVGLSYLRSADARRPRQV